MKSKINFKTITTIFSLAASALFLFSCTKGSNDSYEKYGPVDSLAASFTVTPVQGDANKYVITNTTPGACVGTRWDLGKGDGWVMGKVSDTAFYPDAGTYAINMQALDKRGKLYNASPINVTVTQSDPAYGNLIANGKMDSTNTTAWQIFHTESAAPYGITWTLTNGAYIATGGTSSYPSAGIYQAINVVANKSYHFSMNTSYGVPNSAWLQVYFGTTAPVNGSDYTDNQKLNFITWGTWTAFNGTGSCDLTFATSGTIYVVIKAGSGASGGLSTQGVAVWNVSFRGN